MSVVCFDVYLICCKDDTDAGGSEQRCDPPVDFGFVNGPEHLSLQIRTNPFIIPDGRALAAIQLRFPDIGGRIIIPYQKSTRHSDGRTRDMKANLPQLSFPGVLPIMKKMSSASIADEIK